MPTYQYVCDSCGHEFEEFQPITDDPVAACPKCGDRPRRLVTGGAGFIFKGTGFYQTDYRSKDYQSRASKEKSESTAAKADSKSDSTSGSKSASKSDSKSETKPSGSSATSSKPSSAKTSTGK